MVGLCKSSKGQPQQAAEHYVSLPKILKMILKKLKDCYCLLVVEKKKILAAFFIW